MNNKTVHFLLLALAAAAIGAGGYWLGSQSQPGSSNTAAPAAPERKPLYYRNPMGLADTSPLPKKDAMGMDYIPVYAGEDEPGAAGTLRISTEKIQKLGVRTEPASMRLLGKTLRAAGRIEADERRSYAVSARFEAYVERLHVNTTGQAVAKGQPLFEAYSPELLAAQREYLLARQGVEAMREAGVEAQASMRQLADASLARLRNWDVPSAQLAALVQSGQAQRSMSFASPVAGIVTEKKALQGMRFMPGELLFQITDLSSVWVIADVAEQDIAMVKVGARARVSTSAYPGEVFEGRIAYIYPTLKAETRSVPVRVELANPGLRLKPAMFAQLELAVGGSTPVLAVPESAVIDSGTRRIALVQLGEGRFEPRELELGARTEHYVEVRKGLREGERVVVAANFLIDAESQLKAAVGPVGPVGPLGQVGQVGQGGQGGQGGPVSHRAEGTLDGIDAGQGTLSITHGPVASLKWPAMTMEFKAANAALLAGLKPGQALRFEFVERQPGDYVVTAIAAQAASAPPASHAGH
ncbi:efflux RND transporter periplasmic adaptor subunit [Paucibacter soli]|uniref:efflux RND transporter periplasmic adaptor subunit n=1 Tax=Paucibacter soli TaxID=3133433 RepID=UPI0030AD6EF8